MIQNIKLKNFTIFDSLDVSFSPKINIILGENGTGKSHLLKTIYAIGTANKAFKRGEDINKETFESALTKRLENTFLPMDTKLGKLHRQKAKENAEIKALFTREREVSFTFRNNSKTVSLLEVLEFQKKLPKPVFIPTKEVLSFMEGFISLYNEYKLSFDITYYDIISQLDLPLSKEEKLSPKSNWAIEQIENVMGGKFIFYGGGRVTFKSKEGEYSANAIAEGFRKAGILTRLLETRAIEPGISGPLLWDEPEANMNPKMMNMLAEILLELSRNGQQIILATHDYVVMKWFDLLMDKGKEDHVRFITLYHDPDSGEIKSQSADDYRKVVPNAIASSFRQIYDADIDKSFGDIQI